MRFLTPVFVVVLTVPGETLQGEQDSKAVSFEKDLMPIFRANCVSCHKPDKKKGKLDMSTYADLMKGGKQGSPVKPGEPEKSILVEMISGPEPEMPEKGEKLKPEQVDLISRWVRQGAKRN
jgi:mono/diheme cytochrome c family protein